MKLKLLEEEFALARLDSPDMVDWSAPYCFVQKTPEEISVLCPRSLLPAQVEKKADHWRGFCIDGKLNYSLIGITAKITAALASNSIGVFTVSGCNNNYFFIKAERLPEAVEALSQKGYFLA